MADEPIAQRASVRTDLTADELRRVLNYDPETGVFTWRYRPEMSASWNSRWVGKRAGGVNAEGYRYIEINKVGWRANRLACLYMRGEWPTHEADHANGVHGDDRWDNLRDATRSQNQINTPTARTNKSGLRGVHRHAQGRWAANITIDGVQTYLGLFDTPEQAHAAYVEAARTHHGEFSRFK